MGGLLIVQDPQPHHESSSLPESHLPESQPPQSQPPRSQQPGSPEQDGPVYVAIEAGIEFSQRDYGGRTSYVAHHSRTGQYYRMGVEEYHVAVLLDGSRTVAEVHQQIQQDGLGWSTDDVGKFAAELIKQKLASPHSVACDAGDQNADSAANSEPPPGKPTLSMPQRLVKTLSMTVSQRFPLADGVVIAKKADGIVGPVFSRTGLFIWMALVVSGMMVVFGHGDEFGKEIRRLFDPGIWIFLMAFWVIAKVLHETGHAVCAHRHGVRLGKTGIMFFLFAPLAYVDVTDAWKLQSRMRRVQIALAGVYLELAVAAVAAWAWWMLPIGTARHFAAQIFLVTGPTTLLVNANPLLRLDGYYVLSDLLEIPNLRMHGRAQLGALIERILLGIPRPQSRLFGWRRSAATLHAACSVVFQFFWMAGLIVAVSMWARGLGLVIAASAFLLWALLPLTKWIVKVWTLEPGGRFGLNRYRQRLIGYAFLMFTVLQQCSFSTSPLDRRVPVIVQFQNEQVARASADAFVTAVLVQRGDRVHEGALLMQLEQPELILRREEKADEIELAKQREIQFRRRDEISSAAAERENAASLSRQLAELDEQIQGLRVVALRDGKVTSSAPQRLLGVYVNRGQELIRVSDPREKELLAVVGKDDTEAYQQAALSGSSSSVRLRGGTTFLAKLEPLLPRAIEKVPNPALAANVGGPVAVEPSPDPDQPMKMVTPHGQSKTPLNAVTSLQIRSGQIGTMTISDDRSLMSRIYEDLVESSQPQ